MPLKVFKYNRSKNLSFYDHLFQECAGNITSIEESCSKRENSIVMGEVVRTISNVTDPNRVIILIQELIRKRRKGHLFKAVIHGELALQVNQILPQSGDFLAFYEPFIYPDVAFSITNSQQNILEAPTFIVEVGVTGRSLMWCGKEDFRESDQEKRERVVSSIFGNVNQFTQLLGHNNRDRPSQPLMGIGRGLYDCDCNEAKPEFHCREANPNEVIEMKLLLEKVIPEPKDEPLDLVSGYCFDGCRQLFLYTNLHWQDDSPHCPKCLTLHVKLMFMLELEVTDLQDTHATVLVCREHAETFLNCYVEDFVLDQVLRSCVIQRLTDYIISPTLRFVYPPQLSASLIRFRHHYVIIDTQLFPLNFF